MLIYRIRLNRCGYKGLKNGFESGIYGAGFGDIPFDNPVGAVRVGFWDGECHINPTSADMKTKSELNLLVAGTEKAICMVESGARELSEENMVRALVQD